MQRDTLRHDVPGELLCDMATRQKVHAALTMSIRLPVCITLFGAPFARGPRLTTPPNTARFDARAHERKSATATAPQRRETTMRQEVHEECTMPVQLSVRVSLFGAADTVAAVLKQRVYNVTHCGTMYLASFFATWRHAKRCTQHVQCSFNRLCASLSLHSRHGGGGGGFEA